MKHLGEKEKERFIRLATKEETTSQSAKNKAFNSFPKIEGQQVVYKPYGSQGNGFYYIPEEGRTGFQPKHLGEIQSLSEQAKNFSTPEEFNDYLLEKNPSKFAELEELASVVQKTAFDYIKNIWDKANVTLEKFVNNQGKKKYIAKYKMPNGEVKQTGEYDTPGMAAANVEKEAEFYRVESIIPSTQADIFVQLKKNLQTIADKITDKYGISHIKIETSDLSAKGKAAYHTFRIKGGKIHFPKDITIYNFKEIAGYPGEIIHDLAHELSHHILNKKIGSLQHTSKQGELEDEIGLFISRNFKDLLNKQQLGFKHLE